MGKSGFLRDNQLLNEEEMKRGLIGTDLLQDSDAAGGLPLLSDGRTIYSSPESMHSVIIGSRASGKTARIGAPLLYSAAAAGHGILAHTADGELYRLTREYLESKGYKIHVVHLQTPGKGAGWNPLLYGARKYEEGDFRRAVASFEGLAKGLLRGVDAEALQRQKLMAVKVFVGLCLIACREVRPEEVTLPLLYSMLLDDSIFGRNGDDIKFYIYSSKDRVLMGEWKLFLDAQAEDCAVAVSFLLDVLSALYLDKGLSGLLAGSDFEARELHKGKTAIFVLSGDGEITSVLAAQLIHTLLTELMELKEKETRGNRIDVILDDFSSLPPLPLLAERMARCEKRGICLHLFIQSMHRLKDAYGEHAAAYIAEDCRCLLYLHTAETETLGALSARCGSRTEADGTERPLLNSSKLQHFSKEEGEALVLLDRRRPFITKLPDCRLYMEKLGIRESDGEQLPAYERKNISSFSFRERVWELRQVEEQKEYEAILEEEGMTDEEWHEEVMRHQVM